MLLEPELFGFPPYGSDIQSEIIPTIKKRVIDALIESMIDVNDCSIIVVISHSNENNRISGYIFNSEDWYDGVRVDIQRVHNVYATGTPGVYKTTLIDGSRFILIGRLFNWKND